MLGPPSHLTRGPLTILGSDILESWQRKAEVISQTYFGGGGAVTQWLVGYARLVQPHKCASLSSSLHITLNSLVHIFSLCCMPALLYFPLGVDKPLLKVLLPAIPRLAVSWRALGLKLGAKDYTLDLVQQSHKGDPEKCCLEMLLNWLIGKQDCGDCPRTWDDLLRVIESEMGSEACGFIKKEILNSAEEQVERRPVEGTSVHFMLLYTVHSCLYLCFVKMCVCV